MEGRRSKPHRDSSRTIRTVEVVLLVVAGVAIVTSVALLLTYNRFVRLRNLIGESWHDIDTELQRRYDLIPNLVETVKGYAAHERAVFESVTALRTQAMAEQRPPDVQAPIEQALGRGVAQVLAVAENYPDLKTSEQFLSLQHELVDTEDRIQVARRIYNANVRAYNNMVQSFPSMLLANALHYETRPFFEVDDAVRNAGPPPVDVSG
jgi:LemA protein